MTDSIIEFEKKMRKGEKFKETPTKGETFRKKLKEVSKTEKEDNKSSNGGIKKIFDVEEGLKNLKKDDRFPSELTEQIKKKFKNKKIKLQPAFKKDKAPVIGNVKNLAKGGRAGLKGGGICKRGMNRKAIGKNS
tara:strand:- start:43 stop:444 length:402 start_codon:yes stop_codon:yes gene_type:complete